MVISRPGILEAAVVGLPSETWGQKVAAIIALGSTDKGAKQWSAMDVRRALKDRLAKYKIPQVVKTIHPTDGGLPRNAMGKGKCTNEHP